MKKRTQKQKKDFLSQWHSRICNQWEKNKIQSGQDPSRRNTFLTKLLKLIKSTKTNIKSFSVVSVVPSKPTRKSTGVKKPHRYRSRWIHRYQKTRKWATRNCAHSAANTPTASMKTEHFFFFASHSGLFALIWFIFNVFESLLFDNFETVLTFLRLSFFLKNFWTTFRTIFWHLFTFLSCV